MCCHGLNVFGNSPGLDVLQNLSQCLDIYNLNVVVEDGRQSCAEIQTSSLLVPLGSPVSASCAISDGCPLVLQPGGVIEWQLNADTLPSSSSISEGERLSTVFIPSFNLSMASLTCVIQDKVLAGVEIKAGCEYLSLYQCFVSNCHFPVIKV